MTTSYYELALFDVAINGELAPKALPIISAKDLAQFLEKHLMNSFGMTLAHFEFKEDAIEIKHRLSINNAHPLADQYFSFENSYFISSTNSRQVPKLLEQLNIPADNVQVVITDDQEAFITRRIKWLDLDFEHLKYVYYNTLLKQERDMLRRQIRAHVFHLPDPQQVEFYIRKIQNNLNSLVEKCIEEGQLDPDHESLTIQEHYQEKDHYAIIHHYLEDLLCFIEKEYEQYLDASATIPIRSTLHNREILREKVEFIALELTQMELTWDFMPIVVHPLRKATTYRHSKRINYQQSAYLNALISILHKFLGSATLTQHKLSKLLIELNFNHPAFYEFLIADFKKSLKAITDTPNKIIYLQKQNKRLEQMQTRIQLRFDERHPDLQVQLIHWVQQELIFLNHLRDPETVPQPSPLTNANDKIRSNLSVAQLALFFKLLSESECISALNQQDILKFISQHFKTSTTDNISVKSLHNNYYQHDQKTIQEVRFKLLEMLNLIQNK